MKPILKVLAVSALMACPFVAQAGDDVQDQRAKANAAVTDEKVLDRTSSDEMKQRLSTMSPEKQKRYMDRYVERRMDRVEDRNADLSHRDAKKINEAMGADKPF
jgi:hypothetical protein